MVSTSLPPSRSPQICPCGECTTRLDAALCWYRFGFKVIPVLPKSKKTAVKWDEWLKDLSEEKIKNYWEYHPDHELGAIVGDDLSVFDADTPESISSLCQIEKILDVSPSLVVKTKKGMHHYYKRAKGAFAKSDGHSSEQHPERIDVKTGRALIILPPSTNKSVEQCEVESVDELSEAGQEFIDTIFRHNARNEPRPPLLHPKPGLSSPSIDLLELSQYVNQVDPDSGYEDWSSVVMATHAETQGSDEGFAVADKWSSRGVKYPGTEKLRYIWDHLRTDVENPKTLGTIIYVARQQGADVGPKIKPTEACEVKALDSPVTKIPGSDLPENPLQKYSLKGQVEELESEMADAVPVLDKIAIRGELTAIYAAAGIGKTLTTLWLLIRAILGGSIDANKVYYINADDSASGLVAKLKLADKYGFHMLSPGYNDFQARDFVSLIIKMTDLGLAEGCIIILDTVKKFTDLMNKSRNSEFNTILRSFSLKGGTVIAIAHTNKKKDKNGNSVHAGTSDMRDDFDCVYIADIISHDAITGEKVIKLTADKIRVAGANELVLSYRRTEQTTYLELFESVQLLDSDTLKRKKYAVQMREDQTDIDFVTQLIRDGIVGKMELAAEAAKLSVTSKKKLLQIIDQYTGDDTDKHRWNFVRKERGLMEYYLIDSDV